MNVGQIRDLLDRLEVVRHACDLGLLLFLHRHSRVLLASDKLAAYTGCDPKKIAHSCQVLIDAGLLERRESRSRGARMYALVHSGQQGEWLKSLLAIASTRSGRAQVLQALAPASSPEGGGRDPAPAQTPQ